MESDPYEPFLRQSISQSHGGIGGVVECENELPSVSQDAIELTESVHDGLAPREVIQGRIRHDRVERAVEEGKMSNVGRSGREPRMARTCLHRHRSGEVHCVHTVGKADKGGPQAFGGRFVEKVRF